MLTSPAVLLAVLILIVATLYSTVGHGGASGYLAAMALMGVAPSVMKPTSLILNILVASIATMQFARSGHFRWRLLWPFAVASIPAAMLGGAMALPGSIYKPLIGVVLLASAWRLAMPMSVTATEREQRDPSLLLSSAIGAGLGLLSGLSGTGGGIFLSPILLLRGWASARQTAAVSAAFILVNSIAGLAGLLASGQPLPVELARWWIPWSLAAIAGGLIGSNLGARRIQAPVLRRLLAIVLLIAGAKLVAGAFGIG